MSKLHFASLFVISIIMVFGLYAAFASVETIYASSASTNVSQDVTNGTLSISNTGDQSLSSTAVSTSNQNTTGTLGTITVTDSRGSGVGWNTTATSTHFIKVNAAVMTAGSNNTVTSDVSSTFDHATGGTYTITITSGGSSGVAQFSVAGLETASNVTTGSGIAIGTYGVKATFASATYVNGDSWTIRVDVLPVSGFRVTPGSVTTIAGSSTNVTGGSQHTFTTTSDATALITATSGYGLGSYSVAPALQLTVPANSYANTYTATVTETAS